MSDGDNKIVDVENVKAVVCIPTFRRPEWLARTITSVTEQITHFDYAVVVVDNDAKNPVGAECAHRLLFGKNHHYAVRIEPSQGNCYAINRAFSDAQTAFPQAEFFLMIDDDEIAMQGWLSAIVSLAEEKDADIVGGPVRRNFEVETTKAVMEHPLFFSIEGETRPVDQLHGSGNCLIRRRVFEQLPSPLFDTRFNFLGGGDMEFFTRCRHLGFKSWWCEEAEVREFVPAERISARFLMKRSIRTGSINYAIDRMYRSFSYVLAKNAISPVLGIVRSIGLLGKTGSFLQASHPLLMPIGRIIAALGFLPTPYKSK